MRAVRASVTASLVFTTRSRRPLWVASALPAQWVAYSLCHPHTSLSSSFSTLLLLPGHVTGSRGVLENTPPSLDPRNVTLAHCLFFFLLSGVSGPMSIAPTLNDRPWKRRATLFRATDKYWSIIENGRLYIARSSNYAIKICLWVAQCTHATSFRHSGAVSKLQWQVELSLIYYGYIIYC